MRNWGINVYRSVYTFPMPQSDQELEKGWKSGERHALSPTFEGGYHVPDRFAEVTLGPKR